MIVRAQKLALDISLHQSISSKYQNIEDIIHVAGAWTERKKMFHGGSFLKLADDDV